MQGLRQAAILYLCTLAAADVMIYSQKSHKQIEMEFRDMPSTFGDSIPVEGIRAFVVYANPANACSALTPPPNVPNFTGRWAVLIQRYDCSFEAKVRNAQNATYQIAIVHNVNSSDLERMNTNNPSGISIPSIFVGGPTGTILKDNYLYSKGYYVIIDDDSPFDINIHLLLPFAIVVGLCFITMIGFMVSMIVKCIKDRRRAQRHRLPNSSLQKIPTAVYRRGDPYETCAVCLEDFVEGEKLRILPCSHAYHSNCIDPWLTRGRRVCPMCKRKVFAGCESCTASDSDSESEEDDNTPLLRTSQPATATGGTFNNDNHLDALILSRHWTSILTELNTNQPPNPLPGPSSAFLTIFPSLVGSVNCQANDNSDNSSINSDASVYISPDDTGRRLFDSNVCLTENQDITSDTEGCPRSTRSPSRNVLVGSHEEVNTDCNDIIT